MAKWTWKKRPKGVRLPPSDEMVGKLHYTPAMYREFRRRRREWKKEWAHRNSGVFVTIPDWNRPDAVWEKRLDEEFARARVTLRWLRDLYRAGKEPPDPHEEAARFLEWKLFGGGRNALKEPGAGEDDAGGSPRLADAGRGRADDGGGEGVHGGGHEAAGEDGG